MKNDRFILINSSNKLICEGLVKEYFRGDAEFQVDHGVEALQEITRGQLIRFAFKEGRRGIFEGKVIDIKGNQILLEDVRSLANVVKEDVRVDTDFETRVYAKNTEEQLLAWDVSIADISATGSRILCDAEIPINRIIEVAIPYHSQYIIVDMVVLREIEGDSDSVRTQNLVQGHMYNHSYGCKFYDLTNTEENMLRGMVFQIAVKKVGK